jgi:hypothetical protein
MREDGVSFSGSERNHEKGGARSLKSAVFQYHKHEDGKSKSDQHWTVHQETSIGNMRVGIDLQNHHSEKDKHTRIK